METIIRENNPLDIVIGILYLFGIFSLVRKFKVLPKKSYVVAGLIGAIHLLFTIVYYLYTFTSVADAKGYYLNVYYGFEHFNQTSLADGTSFIGMILYPLIHIFGMSYLSCFLFFSFFSLLGVYKLYEILLKENNYVWTNWFYLILLPSIHFWTSSIGKDSLIFYSICCLLYAYYFKKSYKNYILPILLIGLIRFYILAFIVGGFFIALIILSKQIKLPTKFFLIFIFTIGISLATPYFFSSINFSGIGEIEEKKAIISEANMEGGGAVNLTNSNILIKWVSYVFRPFIFEVKNIFGLITAVENIFWLIIFFMMFKGIRTRKVRKQLNTIFWICFVCIFTITVPAAFILSNLGIAARQKIMIVPFLFTLFFILHRIKKSSIPARKDGNRILEWI